MIPATLARAPRRTEVFEFIKAEVRDGHPVPSPQAIADHMNWKSSASASICLLTLCTMDEVLEAYIAADGKRQYRLKEPV